MKCAAEYLLQVLLVCDGEVEARPPNRYRVPLTIAPKGCNPSSQPGKESSPQKHSRLTLLAPSLASILRLALLQSRRHLGFVLWRRETNRPSVCRDGEEWGSI